MHITTTDYESQNGPIDLDARSSWTLEVSAAYHDSWTFEFASESDCTIIEAIAACRREIADNGWTLMRLLP